MARRSRDLPMMAAFGAFTVHAFFVLSPNMHENHQLFEVPLLVPGRGPAPDASGRCSRLSAPS